MSSHCAGGTRVVSRRLPYQVVSLVHYVELSKADWWDTAVERCVLGGFWLLKGPAHISQLKKTIENELGLHLRTSEIKKALDALQKQKKILKLNDGRWKLSSEATKQLGQQVDEIGQLRGIVQKKFEKIARDACPNLDAGRVWTSFIDEFLIPLIQDVGARVYEFFGRGGRQGREWTSYTEQFLSRISEQCRDRFNQVIFDFLNPDDSDVKKFILSYLDAYFVIAASGLSSEISNKLRGLRDSNIEFIMFVDTNFVFSILGLHSNPLNEAANDLMEMVSALPPGLNVRFVVSSVTLTEIRQSIRYYHDQLGDSRYSANLATAVVHKGISGVYKAYFEHIREAGKEISPSEYFEPYETDLHQILNGKGVNILNDDIGKYENYPNVIDDIDRQVAYEARKYGARAKSKRQVTNDVVLWHFVRDRRDVNLSQSPLEAKYWIITVDYRFLNFDRFKAEKEDIMPLCMLPSQFIQILKFFVPRSPKLDKMILSTMRFPLITREFDVQAEKMTLRILNRLARFEIDDLPIEVVEKVITNQALRSRLKEDISDDMKNEAIRDTLVQEYEKIIHEQKEEIKRQQESAKVKETERLRLQTQLDNRDKKIEHLEHLLMQYQHLLMQYQQFVDRVQQVKDIIHYVGVCIALLLPYPVLLAVLMMYFFPETDGVIGVIITITAAFVALRLLVSLGDRFPGVVKTTVFAEVRDKLGWQAFISFLISLFWKVMSSLFYRLLDNLWGKW